MVVRFYESVDDSLLKFAVIFAMYDEKYIFVSISKGVHSKFPVDIVKKMKP